MRQFRPYKEINAEKATCKEGVEVPCTELAGIGFAVRELFSYQAKQDTVLLYNFRFASCC